MNSRKTKSRISFTRLGIIGLAGLVLGVNAAIFSPRPASPSVSAVGAFGSSLRFYGNGINDIDRIKIRIDNPENALDIGAGDFTIEWWMKALGTDNRGALSCNTNDGWITGNVLFDRDIWGGGDYGDFGIALGNGRVGVGVTRGNSGTTICSTRSVTDGTWHHVAVTRSGSTGQIQIYIDGTLDGQGTGPTGNVSYRNGRSTQYNNDPYLVIGAEKHDAGREYPSYSGFLDEVRISNIRRYTAGFVFPRSPFVPDASTVGLFHFDEGSGTTAVNSVSGGIAGLIRYGGNPYGPVYSQDTPLENSTIPTSTPFATSTPIVPTNTPQPTIFSTPTPTTVPSIAPTPTIVSSITPTPVVGTGQFMLQFDGGDSAFGSTYTGATGTQTIEAWVMPTTNNQSSLVLLNGNSSSGWSLELENGIPTFWVDANGAWNSTRHQTTLIANRWYHIAVTYQNGNATLFVDGNPNQSVSIGSISNSPGLRLGGLSGYPYFRGMLDEIRISNSVRYTTTFARPTNPFVVDSQTVVLYHLNEGSGQYIQGDANRGPRLTLGTNTAVQSSDPTWVISTSPASQ